MAFYLLFVFTQKGNRDGGYEKKSRQERSQPFLPYSLTQLFCYCGFSICSLLL